MYTAALGMILIVIALIIALIVFPSSFFGPMPGIFTLLVLGLLWWAGKALIDRGDERSLASIHDSVIVEDDGKQIAQIQIPQSEGVASGAIVTYKGQPYEVRDRDGNHHFNTRDFRLDIRTFYIDISKGHYKGGDTALSPVKPRRTLLDRLPTYDPKWTPWGKCYLALIVLFFAVFAISGVVSVFSDRPTATPTHKILAVDADANLPWQLNETRQCYALSAAMSADYNAEGSVGVIDALSCNSKFRGAVRTDQFNVAFRGSTEFFNVAGSRGLIALFCTRQQDGLICAKERPKETTSSEHQPGAAS